jgi:hypothetical protein
MSLPFDPSTLSVKKAAAKLEDLSAEELEALRDEELAGKNRITLITAIDVVLDGELWAAEEDPIPVAASQPEVAQVMRPRFSRSAMRDIRNAAKASRPSAPQTIQFSAPTFGILVSQDHPVEEPVSRHEESVLLLD